MMRKSVLVLTVIAVLTAGALFASGSAPRSSAVTVGDFAVKVAKALGYKATDQKSAVSSLKAAGVSLEAADLSSSLTEGKAARILSDLGLKVNTADPASPLTTQKANSLASLVGLGASSASSVSDVELPKACLELRNRGQCDTCCTNYLASLGFSTDTPICAKFCSSVIPPGQASDSEPQP